MPGVTKEQVALAREIDALTYLRANEPGAIRRSAPNEYCLVAHDSLKLSNGKWYWFSRGVGGKSALDFLITVRGYEFVDAVELLSDGHAPAYTVPPPTRQPVQPEPRKVLVLPPHAKIPSHAVAYLQRRGIDAEIISACMERGLLYESSYGGRPVCVFVGKDYNDTPRYAAMRGTDGDFKQDCPGSDKRFGFSLSHNSRSLTVCESPIDAMSLATLCKIQHGCWDEHEYLSLGGTSPLALMQYLRDHPRIEQVQLCLDNDAAGRDGTQRLIAAIRDDPVLGSRIKDIADLPPQHGKDYNEQLIAVRENRKEHFINCRLNSEAAISL